MLRPEEQRSNMLLPELLAASADRLPEKSALIFPSGKIGFGDLDRQSGQVASRLRRLGIGAGERVAILYENSLAAVVFFWGILKSGAQVVDVPNLAATTTVEQILRECKPAVLVASERQLKRVVDCGADWVPRIVMTHSSLDLLDQACHSLEKIIASEDPAPPQQCTRESDVALIVYTSGTTGTPKGVMLSHRNLLSNIHAVNSLMGLTSRDSILVVVPLHFIHGRMQLLTHALIGGTMVFAAGFQFPQQVVDALARHSVTGFSGVPYHFSTLLERTTLATTPLPHLRYVVITGGVAPRGLLRNLSKALPHTAIHIGYGQTEASPRMSNLSPTEVLCDASLGAPVGVPIPGVRIDVVDEHGSTLPAGAIGEIVVSGPNVMCGYVSGDESTSGKIDAFGRLHTGDLGLFDSNARLFITGRRSELIKCAGERIFAGEIESVLYTHPAVRECAAIGIPDDVLGEKVVVSICLHAGTQVSAEDIRSHCLKFLPFVRVPRKICFTETLPKTASGKIDRSGLRSQFSDSKPAEHLINRRELMRDGE